jgi:hypothetical protein
MTDAQVSQALAQQDLQRRNCRDGNSDEFFGGNPKWAFSACRYRDQLEAMEEQPLDRPEARAVRFLWLRSFHEPILVRVDFETAGTAMLVAKRSDGAGGYLPGCLVAVHTVRLDATQARELQDLLAATERTIPAKNEHGEYANPSSTPDVIEIIMDGAEWILERVDESGYRVDNPYAPLRNPALAAYVRLCRRLLELANIQVPDSEMY